ncbi:MAG: S8 family serine peptidase, partial [Saprospiraceae bacterium]
RIKKAKPLIPQLIDRMVKENRTETAIHQAIYEKRMAKKGRKNVETKTFAEYHFARAMYLTLTEPIAKSIVDQPEMLKKEMAAAGFRVRSLGLDYFDPATSLDPNDPLYPRLWQHRLTQAPIAWAQQSGEADVIIGILDSGVELWHEDLWDKLLPGYDFVDYDITTTPSWMLVPGEDYENEDEDPSDRDGHGTHIAGIAAAVGNNDLGVIGVCPGCAILPLRLMSTRNVVIDGDTIPRTFAQRSKTPQALYYAAEQGVDVLNMSFSTDLYYNEMELKAFKYAYEMGVVMVAGAGNQASETPRQPATLDQVISVAATYEDDVKADFSNYGKWIDLSAPGFDIISTTPYEGLQPPYISNVLVTDGEELPLTQFLLSRDIPEDGIEVSLNYVGMARQQDLLNPNYNWNLNGKIAVVDRGEIGLIEKTQRVKDYGAIGIIFVNTEDVPMFFQAVPQFQQMYVLSMAKSQGQRLIEQIKLRKSLPVALYADEYLGYAAMDGTSMATPYVAGAAGLLLSEYPWLSPDEVKARLLAAVDNIDHKNPAYVGKLGTGRINLAKLFGGTTAIEDEPAKAPQSLALKIFPNPAQDFVNVILPTVKNEAIITIYNNIGQVVQTQQMNAQNQIIRLNTSALPAGMYVVEVMQEGEFATQKIIKQ